MRANSTKLAVFLRRQLRPNNRGVFRLCSGPDSLRKAESVSTDARCHFCATMWKSIRCILIKAIFISARASHNLYREMPRAFLLVYCFLLEPDHIFKSVSVSLVDHGSSPGQCENASAGRHLAHATAPDECLPEFRRHCEAVRLLREKVKYLSFLARREAWF